MKEFKTTIIRLERMDFLIRTHSTGNPDEFACKLNVCRRTMQDYLSFLKEYIAYKGVSIVYDHFVESYVYTRKGKFEIKFDWTDEE